MRLKTTLEQWLTLSKIDKSGSIQAAAAQLNKSHTTLIYSIRKLESQLDISLVKVKGRKAVLTNDGKSLLRRAESMLEQAKSLEEISTKLTQGIESELVIAVDHLCYREWIYSPLKSFLAENNITSIQVVETSLSKTITMVEQEQADIAVINIPITNHPCEVFGAVDMLPVVNKCHPLADKSSLCLSDLTTSAQIVIRDLGESNKKNVGWLKSKQRITVDNFDHAWQAVKQGLGYCRLPNHLINAHNDDEIITLNIEHSSAYQIPLHITLPKGANTGPAAKALYQLLLSSVDKR